MKLRGLFVSTHSPVLGLQVHTTMLGFFFFNADGSSPQVLMLVQQELYWLSPLLFFFLSHLLWKGIFKQEEAILTISFLLYVQFAVSAETPSWFLGAQTSSLMNKNWRHIVRVFLLGQTKMELSRVKGSSVFISYDYKDLIHPYSSGLVSCMMTQWQHSTHYSSSFCDSCYA